MNSPTHSFTRIQYEFPAPPPTGRSSVAPEEKPRAEALQSSATHCELQLQRNTAVPKNQRSANLRIHNLNSSFHPAVRPGETEPPTQRKWKNVQDYIICRLYVRARASQSVGTVLFRALHSLRPSLSLSLSLRLGDWMGGWFVCHWRCPRAVPL